MLGRRPGLLQVLRPLLCWAAGGGVLACIERGHKLRLKACARLLLIHAGQSRACGTERLRQRRRRIIGRCSGGAGHLGVEGRRCCGRLLLLLLLLLVVLLVL